MKLPELAKGALLFLSLPVITMSVAKLNEFKVYNEIDGGDVALGLLGIAAITWGINHLRGNGFLG